MIRSVMCAGGLWVLAASCGSQAIDRAVTTDEDLVTALTANSAYGPHCGQDVRHPHIVITATYKQCLACYSLGHFVRLVKRETNSGIQVNVLTLPGDADAVCEFFRGQRAQANVYSIDDTALATRDMPVILSAPRPGRIHLVGSLSRDLEPSTLIIRKAIEMSGATAAPE